MFNKSVIASIITFTLSACVSTGGSPDNYGFERRNWDTPVATIEKVEYDSFTDLRKAAREIGNITRLDMTAAFIEMYKPGVCRIHIVKPERRYMPHYFGHEVMHCFYGNFHRHKNSGPPLSSSRLDREP